MIDQRDFLIELKQESQLDTNSKGAKQSKIKVRYDLIDSRVFARMVKPKYLQYSNVVNKAIAELHRAATLLHSKSESYAYDIADCLQSVLYALGYDNMNIFSTCAKVLYEGSEKGYSDDNWRKIAILDHINHALNHLYMWEEGDDNENHKEHAICRTYMAYACYLAQVEGDENI